MVAGNPDFDRRVKRLRDRLLKNFHRFVEQSMLEGEQDGREVATNLTASLQIRMDNLVRDRKRMDELILGPQYEQRVPWFRNRKFWKDVAIRGAILAFNYWQATRQLNALRAGNLKREQYDPTGPTF